MQFPAGQFSGELPLNRDAVTICLVIPCLGLSAQRSDIPDPAISETLAAEEADLNLSLVQPTSMLGRVMHGEALPQPSASFFAESIHQRFAGVGAQVVYDQMDDVGGGVVLGDLQQKICKLRRRAGGRHFGEMDTRLGFNATEHVGGSAALVFIVAPPNPSRLQGNRWPHILMQYHGLFIDADYRLAFR